MHYLARIAQVHPSDGFCIPSKPILKMLFQRSILRCAALVSAAISTATAAPLEARVENASCTRDY